MSIEGRDINDGDIISSTEQLTDSNGNTKFKIVLPNGKPLESEWLNQDNVKKALIPWVEAVRGRMVDDAEEARLAVRREMLEQVSKRPSIVLPAGVDVNPLPVASLPAGYSLPTNVALSSPNPGIVGSATSNPLGFVEASLVAAIRDKEYWQAQAATAAMKFVEAQNAVVKWTQISQAIGGNTNVLESSQVHVYSPDVTTGSEPVRARRGRKPGSKNKPKPEPIPDGGF